MVSSERRVGFAAPLRVREFRYLWAAELASVAGDQLARVALAVLVFNQTSSASLTALTYALTFVPAVLGGTLLSGLADRFPRRAVLVVTDLLRAGLAAAMAVPGLPIPVLWVLVAVLSAAAGPFKAAQLAIIPQVLTVGVVRQVGNALRQVTAQTAQVVGFMAGGVLLTVLDPSVALLLNSLTFVVSAALIMIGVRVHRIAHASTLSDTAAVGLVGTVWPLFALASLVGLYVVPEGIAAPYAHELGLAAIGVAVLMAADPVGSVVGGWVASRGWVPTSMTATVWFAIGAGVPLVVCAFSPGIALSVALWAASGVMSTILLVQMLEQVVQRVPDQRRGSVSGRLSTVLQASQGIAILGGGLVAEQFGSFRAVAIAGLLAVVLAAVVGGLVWMAWSRHAHAGTKPKASHQSHQRSLLAITGTSSPGPDCQPNPQVGGSGG
jgi:MFS family permease